MITAHDLLVAHPFMAGVPDRFLSRMAHYSHRVTVREGARIFSECGRADRFWLIRDGVVNLETRLPGRGDVVVESIGPGQVLGWSWLFPPYRWDFGAEAFSPVRAYEFEAQPVLKLCEEEPALGMSLVRIVAEILAHRLEMTRGRLMEEYGSHRRGAL